MPDQEDKGTCSCEDITFLGKKKPSLTPRFLPWHTRTTNGYSVIKLDRSVASVVELTENVQDTGPSKMRCFATKLAKS